MAEWAGGFDAGSGFDAGAGTEGFDVAAAAERADEMGPSTDMDGDGRADTVVFDACAWDEEALVVATDTDLDGTSDRLSVIADDGRYGVWEFVRELDGSSRWTRVDTGSLEFDAHHERTWK